MALNFPSSPTNGQVYNTTNTSYVFNAAANAWFNNATAGGVGGLYRGNNGEVGTSIGYGDIFRLTANTLTQSVVIPAGNNSVVAGPITVQTGSVLSIANGARVSIV